MRHLKDNMYDIFIYTLARTSIKETGGNKPLAEGSYSHIRNCRVYMRNQ